jgi:hypothetical protein
MSIIICRLTGLVLNFETGYSPAAVKHRCLNYLLRRLYVCRRSTNYLRGYLLPHQPHDVK